jgi:hypothetical protein
MNKVQNPGNTGWICFLPNVRGKETSTLASVSMEIFNYGCLAMTRVLHSNDGIRPDTSQYIRRRYPESKDIVDF